MKRGRMTSIVRRTKGRHISVSCSVGLRLPGGRQKMTLVMNTARVRIARACATGRSLRACGREAGRSGRRTACPAGPHRGPALRRCSMTCGLRDCRRDSTRLVAVRFSGQASKLRQRRRDLVERLAGGGDRAWHRRPHRRARRLAARHARRAGGARCARRLRQFVGARTRSRASPAMTARQRASRLTGCLADDLVGAHLDQPLERSADRRRCSMSCSLRSRSGHACNRRLVSPLPVHYNRRKSWLQSGR